LRAVGISRNQVFERLSNGWMRAVGTGIYAIDDLAGRTTDNEVAMAVATAGALSHNSAARLHNFVRAGSGNHLLVPKSTTNRVPGFKVHETRLWFDDDIGEIDGFRITSPARTICDLARTSHPDRLRHLIESQLMVRNPTDDDLIACHQRLRRRGRHGSAKLTALLDELVDDMPFAESVLEQLLFTGLKERGCTGLVRQFRPPWYDGRRGIVDFCDPTGRTIIEADGRRWHSTTEDVIEDHRRDRLAVTYGFVTIRVGWRELKTRPSTFDEIIKLVESRRRQQQQLAA